MRAFVIGVGILCATAFMATPAEAQLCAGSPSFRDRPYQVGIGAAFTEGAQGVGGTFAAGSDVLFAGAGVSVLNFGDLDATATEVSAFAGSELAADDQQRIYVCPAAGITFGVGPDVGAVDISTLSLRGGGSIGVIASQSDALMVIPTFALSAIYTRISAEAAGVEADESDGSGLASVGVGFVLNDNVGITPSLSVPFSAGESDPIFRIVFTFSFGS